MGGLDPDYFARRLTGWELESYLRGVARRAHAGWEQARLVSQVISGVMTGKVIEYDYPWEIATQELTPEEEEQQLKDLRASIPYLTKLIKR